MAKCNLGEVKLERVGLRWSPIAVHDMRGGSLGSCRASLGVCSLCCTALFALLADHSRSVIHCTFLQIVVDSHSLSPLPARRLLVSSVFFQVGILSGISTEFSM